MKKLLFLALMATGMHAIAVESLKTPYGTLALKLSDPENLFSKRVLLDGKPIKGLDYQGYLNISDKSYKLGKQDIYIISFESEGNGTISTQEKYYDLLVFEPGKKPKVVSNDEFWVNRFQDKKEVVFTVKDNKLYGDLGKHDDSPYTMVYDGKSIKVKKGKKIKKERGAKITSLIDKNTCQAFYEDRTLFCEAVITGDGASVMISWINKLQENPGSDYSAIKKLCKDEQAVEKMDYKIFESKICKSTK